MTNAQASMALSTSFSGHFQLVTPSFLFSAQTAIPHSPHSHTLDNNTGRVNKQENARAFFETDKKV